MSVLGYHHRDLVRGLPQSYPVGTPVLGYLHPDLVGGGGLPQSWPGGGVGGGLSLSWGTLLPVNGGTPVKTLPSRIPLECVG